MSCDSKPYEVESRASLLGIFAGGFSGVFGAFQGTSVRVAFIQMSAAAVPSWAILRPKSRGPFHWCREWFGRWRSGGNIRWMALVSIGRRAILLGCAAVKLATITLPGRIC